MCIVSCSYATMVGQCCGTCAAGPRPLVPLTPLTLKAMELVVKILQKHEQSLPDTPTNPAWWTAACELQVKIRDTRNCPLAERVLPPDDVYTPLILLKDDPNKKGVSSERVMTHQL